MNADEMKKMLAEKLAGGAKNKKKNKNKKNKKK